MVFNLVKRYRDNGSVPFSPELEPMLDSRLRIFLADILFQGGCVAAAHRRKGSLLTQREKNDACVFFCVMYVTGDVYDVCMYVRTSTRMWECVFVCVCVSCLVVHRRDNVLAVAMCVYELRMHRTGHLLVPGPGIYVHVRTCTCTCTMYRYICSSSVCR